MNTQTNIIIAENDHDFSCLIQETLKDYGLHSILVPDGKDVIDRVADNQDSLLLLGCNLQDMTGEQVIEILSKRNISVPFIPIIGPGDEKAAVELMKMGADNYIIKGAGLTGIIPLVVKSVLRGFEWEKETAEAEDVLQKKSYLNQIILDRMPCVTLLLESFTREIIASNAAAMKIGAEPGRKCFSGWFKREDPCPWCQAPVLWESGEEQHLKFEALCSIWDAYWVPVEKNMYLHYAFDVTGRTKNLS